MSEEKQQPALEKLKALQLAIDKIEKDHGKGTIMKMGDDHVVDVQVIPTGSIALNNALGVGGYPRGRVVEIYGPESSGKTTLAIHAIAEAQKLGGIAAIIDAEHAFDRFYAEASLRLQRESEKEGGLFTDFVGGLTVEAFAEVLFGLLELLGVVAEARTPEVRFRKL